MTTSSKIILGVIGFLVLVGTLGYVSYVRGPSRPGSDVYWSQLASELKKTLPMAVDKMTTLTDVSYANRTLTFINKVRVHDINAKPPEQIEQMRQDIQRRLIPTVCQSEQVKEILKSDLTVVYDYLFLDGTRLSKTVLTADDCASAPPPPPPDDETAAAQNSAQ